MPKGKPTRSKSVRRNVSHNQCSKRRTVLKDRLRLQEGMITDLQDEVRLFISLSHHQDILALVAQELSLNLDPFSQIRDEEEST